MSGRLVGRTEELAALVGALDGLQRVGASCAQVTGEPGIGKTRLLAELCEIAAARGAVVLVGRGAELERDAPFGIVIDALDDHLRALPTPSLRRLCEPQLGELQPLLPALAGLGSAPARRSEDERYRTYRAIRALIERLASKRPLLLAFDDLHWADAASLELVSFLLRRPPRARVLVVLSWCPGRAPGLTEAVSARARDLPGVTIGLGGLDQTEVGALVGAAFDRRQLERLHRASGGNPFYAQALAGDVCRSGTRSLPADDEPDAVPDSVRSAVAHEIGSLSAPARLLAQGAAVAGEPFELELAARCAGISALAAQPAIDELVLAAIVHPVQGLRRFAFRHPIVRRAVYDSAGPEWRARAHARAAALLSQRGAPATAAAHHVARSAAPGDMAAAELLLAAASEVLTRAPASAAAWLEAAAAIVPEQAETAGIRLALLTAQARVRGLLGELQPAAEALSRAQELIPAGDPLRVELIAGIAGIEHGLGRFTDARERLQAALSEASAVKGVTEARLCIELAVSWLHTLDFAAAADWASRAVRAAQPHDRLLEGTARALLGFVHASTETAAGNRAARAELAPAAAILDALGDEALMPRLDALYYLGWAERLMEDYPAAAAHLGRALALAEAGGGSQWLLPTMVEQAKALCCCGRLAEARELAETAVEMARISQVDLVLLLALTAQVAVLGGAGEVQAATAAAAEALELGADAAPYHAALIRRQLTLARLEAREDPGCAPESAGPGEEAVSDGTACRLLEARVQAELRRGHSAAGAELCARAEALAAALGTPASAGFAARAQAQMLASPDPRAALVLAEAALASFQLAGAAAEAARTRILRGEILSACGSGPEAMTELASAAQTLSECGAEASARRARLALRRVRRAGASRVTDGRTRPGAGALSRREREIAELVAEGLTNREIAARLTLSENTVETHVGRVLAKLGLHGRAGVARAIARVDTMSMASE